jgi:hypothetical protein
MAFGICHRGRLYSSAAACGYMRVKMSQRVVAEHGRWHMTNGAKLIGSPRSMHVGTLLDAPNMG